MASHEIPSCPQPPAWTVNAETGEVIREQPARITVAQGHALTHEEIRAAEEAKVFALSGESRAGNGLGFLASHPLGASAFGMARALGANLETSWNWAAGAAAAEGVVAVAAGKVALNRNRQALNEAFKAPRPPMPFIAGGQKIANDDFSPRPLPGAMKNAPANTNATGDEPEVVQLAVGQDFAPSTEPAGREDAIRAASRDRKGGRQRPAWMVKNKGGSPSSPATTGQPSFKTAMRDKVLRCWNETAAKFARDTDTTKEQAFYTLVMNDLGLETGWSFDEIMNYTGATESIRGADFSSPAFNEFRQSYDQALAPARALANKLADIAQTLNTAEMAGGFTSGMHDKMVEVLTAGVTNLDCIAAIKEVPLEALKNPSIMAFLARMGQAAAGKDLLGQQQAALEIKKLAALYDPRSSAAKVEQMLAAITFDSAEAREVAARIPKLRPIAKLIFFFDSLYDALEVAESIGGDKAAVRAKMIEVLKTDVDDPACIAVIEALPMAIIRRPIRLELLEALNGLITAKTAAEKQRAIGSVKSELATITN